MRILFISHYFPPEVNAPASRTHEHCRRWVADGHEVTVVTGVPNHPAGELFPGYRNRLVQQEVVDGITVIRTWMLLTPNAGFAKRILNYLLFGVAAVLVSLCVRRPDVVVATSPQFFCGLAGAVVSTLRRRPFVLEVRDLWPKSIVELDQLQPGPLLRALEALERWMYRTADGVVVNTRAFIEHIAAAGVDRERIELVYNGIDAERFTPRPPSSELRARYGLEGKLSVAYIGTLGLAHGLDTVLDAAERLRERDDVVFLLIGDGAERARLEATVRERGLERVQLLGLQPRDTMPGWIATIDVLLVCLRDLPVFETVIPSKIFEFLAQERPVIVTARGEIERMAREADVARVAPPEDAAALAEAILDVAAHPNEAMRRARAGRVWVLANFDRDVLARRMLDFLRRTLEQAP